MIRANMRTRRVATKSGVYTLHVDGDDPRKPFALFLHGGPGFNSYGERQVLGGRFRSEVNFLWVDLMGCGDFESTGQSPISWDAQTRDIARMIRQFTSEPVHIVAHCSGGEIAHELMRLDPALVRSFLWYAPVHSMAAALRGILRKAVAEGRLRPQQWSSKQAHELESFLSATREALSRSELLLLLRAVEATRDFYEMYWTDRDRMARWLEWMSEKPFSARAFLDVMTQLHARGPMPLPDYAAVPVRMLYANNDPVMPWELHGLQRQRQIPHATVVEIPDAGHWLQFEKPEECVRRTLEFFALTA